MDLNAFLNDFLQTDSMDRLTSDAAALFDCPVMVVMGNPPYSGISKNNGKWIQGLVEEYKRDPGT